jgi:hypothetical protein
MQAAFHTVPLTLGDWAIATAIGAALLLLVEIVKIVLRAQRSTRQTVTVSGQASVRA